jgi:tetratricopeptide (TPR) repeat protein
LRTVWPKAQSWFDKAKASQSNNALVYYYLAQCKTQQNQLNPALADLQQALKLNVSGKLRTQVYNQGGFIYDKKKDYTNAIRWYQEAGNQSMVRQMEDKRDKAAQNIAAERECAEFKRKIDALRLQVDELQKIGDNDSAQQLLEQLPALEKDYSERCR